MTAARDDLERRRSFWRIIFVAIGILPAVVNAKGGFGKGLAYKIASQNTPPHVLIDLIAVIAWFIICTIAARIIIR